MFHDVKQFHDPRRQNPFQNSSFQDFPRSVVCRRQSNHSISLPKVLGLPRLFTFDRTRIKVLDWNMRNAYKWLQTQFYESFNTNIGRMKFCNGTVMQTTGTIYINTAITEKLILRRKEGAESRAPCQFWNALILKQTELKQKMEITIVYNSVIISNISRLLYGLESLQTRHSAGRLLNTFQL